MNKSFTLIEILVVIVIIGILSAFIIVSMSEVSEKAAIAKGQAFSNSLRNSLLINLVSEYSLNNISGTVEQSLADGTAVPDNWGTKNGTTYGGPVLKSNTSCVSGTCLQFNGSNYVSLPFYFTKAQMESGLTWSIWIKHGINDTNSGHHYQVLTQSTYGGGTYERAGAIVISNKKACFCIYDGSSYRVPCTNFATDDNKWHFIVVTISPISPSPNLNLKTYGDAKQGDSINSNQGGDTAYMNLMVAQANGADATHLNYTGFVDDFKFYNTFMPTSQIQQKYYFGLSKLLLNNSIALEEYKQRIGELENNLANKE